MKKISVNGYTRVTKAAAFRAYRECKTIYICPVNIAPGSMWLPEIALKNNSPRRLEAIINEFEYYNCNAFTGRYTAFYMRAEDLA